MKKRMLVSVAAVLMGLGVTTSVLATVADKPATVMQEEVTYKEIKAGELPETVRSAIHESYADYTLSKAYVGSDGSYKLKLSKGDENIAVFFNASGEFVKVEKNGENGQGTENPK